LHTFENAEKPQIPAENALEQFRRNRKHSEMQAFFEHLRIRQDAKFEVHRQQSRALPNCRPRHFKIQNPKSKIELPSAGEQTPTTPFSQSPSLHLAARVLASFKKSISRIQSVAFSRPARKHPSFQNRTQKPFSDTPYLSRKQGFCADPTSETIEFATIILGKNSPRRKNSLTPIVGPMRHASRCPRKPLAIQDRSPSRTDNVEFLKRSTNPCPLSPVSIHPSSFILHHSKVILHPSGWLQEKPAPRKPVFRAKNPLQSWTEPRKTAKSP
jgi:hypothetical protein